MGNELAPQVSSSECRGGVRHRCQDLGQLGEIGVDHTSPAVTELCSRHLLELLHLVLGHPHINIGYGRDSRFEEDDHGHVLSNGRTVTVRLDRPLPQRDHRQPLGPPIGDHIVDIEIASDHVRRTVVDQQHRRDAVAAVVCNREPDTLDQPQLVILAGVVVDEVHLRRVKEIVIPRRLVPNRRRTVQG
jgi:hypothetical protein